MKLERPDSTGLPAHLSSGKRVCQGFTYPYFTAAPERASCTARRQ